MVVSTDAIKTSRSNWPAIAEGLHAAALKLRDEWKISQPDLNATPRWMRPRVTYAIKHGVLPKPFMPLYGGWWAMRHVLNHLGSEWADHYGRVIQEDGSQILVSEPYQLLTRGYEQLEEFCWTLGLSYKVEARSWWCPGQTLRIVIWEGSSNG